MGPTRPFGIPRADTPVPKLPQPDSQPRTRRRAISPAKAHLRLTASDHDILEFVARHKVLTYPIGAVLTGRSIGALRNRLPRLERVGLLESVLDVPPVAGAIFCATPAGVRASGLPLTGTPLRFGHLAHSLAVAAIAAERIAAGSEIYSDREIRSAALSAFRVGMPIGGGPAVYFGGYAPEALVLPWPTALTTAPASDLGHIADLVQINQRTGSVTIVEVELTRKSRGQWRRIAEAVLKAPWVTHLEYASRDPNLLESVHETIKGIQGFQGRVRFTPI